LQRIAEKTQRPLNAPVRHRRRHTHAATQRE
jgi:hypothetical protein